VQRKPSLLRLTSPDSRACAGHPGALGITRSQALQGTPLLDGEPFQSRGTNPATNGRVRSARQALRQARGYAPHGASRCGRSGWPMSRWSPLRGHEA
jgi:hypothetical protein